MTLARDSVIPGCAFLGADPESRSRVSPPDFGFVASGPRCARIRWATPRNDGKLFRPNLQRRLGHALQPGQYQNGQQRVLRAEPGVDRLVPFVARVPVATLAAAADGDGGN